MNRNVNPFLYIILIFLNVSINGFSQNYNSEKLKYENALKNNKIDSALIYANNVCTFSEKEFGNKDNKYINALNNLALFYKAIGKYEDAINSFNKVLKQKELIFTNKHPNYANTLNSIAGIYTQKGLFNNAEKLYIEAYNIYKPYILNKNDANFKLFLQNYANTVFNLGSLYYYTGKYEKSEPLMVDAYNIRKQLLGENHPDFILSLNNLAVLYKTIGNIEKADEYYKTAISLHKNKQGENNIQYSQLASNIAELNLQWGNITENKDDKIKCFKTAEEYYNIAYSTFVKINGENHPDISILLNGLFAVYNNLSLYENNTENIAKANSFLAKNIDIANQTNNINSISYINAIHAKAKSYISNNEYTKAEEILLEVLNKRDELQGKEHPDFTQTLYDIATVYYEQGNQEKALNYYSQGNDNRIKHIKTMFSFMSESEKEKFLNSTEKDFSKFYSYCVKNYANNNQLSGEIYNNVVATKGMIFNSVIELRNKINKSNNPGLSKIFTTWLEKKDMLGKLSNIDETELIKNGINIKSIEDSIIILEKQLNVTSNAFSQYYTGKEVTWKDIQNKIQENEAVVEIFNFNNFQNKHFEDTTSYYALIITKECQNPYLVYLFNDVAISKLLINPEYTTKLNPYIVVDKESKKLYRQLWKPIDNIVSNKTKLYISVSGVVNKISLPVLITEKDEYLINKYDMIFLNNTKSIINRNEENLSNQKSIALFGGIMYDVSCNKVKEESKKYNLNTSNLLTDSNCIDNTIQNIKKWDYIEGTLIETSDIELDLKNNGWKTSFYSGDNAIEESFKQTSLHSPSVLHISTHGYFINKKDKTNNIKNKFGNSSNRLFHSGLIFSGGNRTWTGGQLPNNVDDGVLTAYEVLNMNFSSTDLVVLSACETGLGDIKSGEGVYGLQRSFQIAGAKSVVMSLWEVPDKETIELMKLFYKYWLEEKSKHNALRKAQIELSKKYKPFYWGAFIMIE